MTTIHATAVVGDGVLLGERTVVGPHAVLLGPLEIGDDCWIGPGAVLGTPPEVRGVEHTAQWQDGHAGGGVRIGSRTVVREMTTIHQGWKGETVVGDDCFIMNKVYVAHDCVLSDGVTIASTVALAGHVRVGAGANLGLGAAVHQRRIVGPGAMVGMGAVVSRDVPPFAKSYGNPARVRGANVVALQRAGICGTDLDHVQSVYAAGGALAVDEAPGLLAEAFAWWAAAHGS